MTVIRPTASDARWRTHLETAAVGAIDTLVAGDPESAELAFEAGHLVKRNVHIGCAPPWFASAVAHAPTPEARSGYCADGAGSRLCLTDRQPGAGSLQRLVGDWVPSGPADAGAVVTPVRRG